MNTTLITGSSGFVGSHLAAYLVHDGEKVVSLLHDNPVWTTWLKEALEPTIRVQGDIRDFHFLKRVLNQYQISTVYHLAGQTIVKRAWQDSVNTFDINVMGTVNLLEACRQLKIKNILIQSTDKIYGPREGATTSSSLSPTEPYATSKICADVAAQCFIKTYNMNNIIIARCCNIYGYDLNDRIIPNTIRECMKRNSPVIYKHDKSKRQYIYIDDVIHALTSLVNSGQNGIFNIATNDILDQEQVVKKILEFFPALEPTYIAPPILTQIKSQFMIPSFPLKKYINFTMGIRRTIETFKRYGHI